ncbi:hypothetical protein J7I98_37595 [Streptomyces sp. ISL-98]|uniref:hypothetical protein n=1 Tax=Streptomyces sp. ISL-98 TaxID=2819192 RepID=UPI001BE696D0|nr:hypothetical protein [Streptomyces sp. ISL-98]MBT2511423.1 hypothetical protein [Streptomyces sp. ISL-98]
MAEVWAHGMINSILYAALYRNAGMELDDQMVRRFAVAMQLQPVVDVSMAKQLEGLRTSLAEDVPLADSFPPFDGQRPYTEAEFRDFLRRLADELETYRPWQKLPEPPAPGFSKPMSPWRRWIRRH